MPLLPGDVGNHRNPTGFIPKAIRWCERRKYPVKTYGTGPDSPAWWNHTFLMLNATKVIEANPGGIEVKNLSEYAPFSPDVIRFFRPPYRDGDATLAVDEMLAMVGEPYAKSLIVSDALYLLFKTSFGFSFKNSHTCSGSTAHVLAHRGFALGDEEERDSPADVFAVERAWQEVFV